MDDSLCQDWIDASQVLAELWEQGMPQLILEAAWRRVERVPETAT